MKMNWWLYFIEVNIYNFYKKIEYYINDVLNKWVNYELIQGINLISFANEINQWIFMPGHALLRYLFFDEVVANLLESIFFSYYFCNCKYRYYYLFVWIFNGRILRLLIFNVFLYYFTALYKSKLYFYNYDSILYLYILISGVYGKYSLGRCMFVTPYV